MILWFCFRVERTKDLGQMPMGEWFVCGQCWKYSWPPWPFFTPATRNHIFSVQPCARAGRFGASRIRIKTENQAQIIDLRKKQPKPTALQTIFRFTWNNWISTSFEDVHHDTSPYVSPYGFGTWILRWLQQIQTMWRRCLQSLYTLRLLIEDTWQQLVHNMYIYMIYDVYSVYKLTVRRPVMDANFPLLFHRVWRPVRSLNGFDRCIWSNKEDVEDRRWVIFWDATDVFSLFMFRFSRWSLVSIPPSE